MHIKVMFGVFGSPNSIFPIRSYVLTSRFNRLAGFQQRSPCERQGCTQLSSAYLNLDLQGGFFFRTFYSKFRKHFSSHIFVPHDPPTL